MTDLPLLRLTLGSAALHSVALAQGLVQPGSYRSASGEFELFVDPTQARGAGPATYRMARSGKTVWEHELPFTFFEALVHDDGSFAGGACTEGYGPSGELVVAVVAADGSVRGEKRAAMQWSRKVDGGFVPWLAELYCGADELVAETRDAGRKCWWLFRWSTRELSAIVQLPPSLEPEIRARAPELPPAPERSSYPELALESRGHVVFPWPDFAEGSDPRARTPHRVVVDGAGRVWISELSKNVVQRLRRAGSSALRALG